MVRNMRWRRPKDGVRLEFNLKWVDVFRGLVAGVAAPRMMVLNVARNWWCAKTPSLRVRREL